MGSFPFFTRLNGLLYRREFARLTPRDRSLAKTWMLQFMKANHPDWSPEKVEKEYQNLLLCRPVALDEWTRRMQG